MIDIQAVCEKAAVYANDSWLRAAHLLLVLLSSVTLYLVGVVLYQRSYRRISVHDNLKILLINIMALFLVISLTITGAYGRLVIQYRTYGEPCELLISTWQTIAARGPMFLYVAAFPMWHLALTLERMWATTKADRYENMHSSYGLIASILVWILSIGYVAWVVGRAYQDETFVERSFYYALTRKTNAQMIILSHWFFLALDLVTTFVDVLLIVVNRRRLTRVSPQYSLSRTYQINENLHVTTGMIVPTDLCNAGLFIVCLTVSTTIRYSMDSWPQHRFASVYDGLYSLLLLQAITSLAIFIHFCNRAKKTARVIGQRSESDLYFELFKKQIAESEKLCMNHQ